MVSSDIKFDIVLRQLSRIVPRQMLLVLTILIRRGQPKMFTHQLVKSVSPCLILLDCKPCLVSNCNRYKQIPAAYRNLSGPNNLTYFEEQIWATRLTCPFLIFCWSFRWACWRFFPTSPPASLRMALATVSPEEEQDWNKMEFHWILKQRAISLQATKSNNMVI